ncbi:hypothetical protein [Vallitalea sp.]|jgi:hypothetical protein|uniref:hypothetical protein n=1 Tax=Vallitalea sp. TaxID=1882829 RepID=UPI0026015F07|nr:hypothetical protein [Vallitalea sp.]MCT4686614.1 hypothetical protein [Vallitalea sp.]
MKYELKKKIEQLIEAYQGNTTVVIEEMKGIIDKYKDKVTVYQPEHIHQVIKSGIEAILSNSNSVNNVYNQKLKVIIEGAKEEILPMYFNNSSKTNDYATKINNALQFLDIEGDSISDEKAFMILKDFIDDYDQLRLFKNVIGKRVELDDANGNTTFPKTFGKLNQIEVIMNTISEMEAIANMLFVQPKGDGQTYVINGNKYVLPIDSYEQIAGEDDIINLATIVEEITDEVSGVGNVTDQTEHEIVEN